jgi:hypothetical protein
MPILQASGGMKIAGTAINEQANRHDISGYRESDR